MAEALKAVKKRLEEVIKTLAEIAENDPANGSNAETLLKSMSNFNFVFNLYVLERVFCMTNILSNYLQSINMLAFDKVHTVLQSLKDMRNEK